MRRGDKKRKTLDGINVICGSGVWVRDGMVLCNEERRRGGLLHLLT